MVGYIAGAHVDALSLLTLRKESNSFFPEFQSVSGICNLNVFSRKNKVAASTLKREVCGVHIL